MQWDQVYTVKKSQPSPKNWNIIEILQYISLVLATNSVIKIHLPGYQNLQASGCFLKQESNNVKKKIN